MYFLSLSLSLYLSLSLSLSLSSFVFIYFFFNICAHMSNYWERRRKTADIQDKIIRQQHYTCLSIKIMLGDLQDIREEDGAT